MNMDPWKIIGWTVIAVVAITMLRRTLRWMGAQRVKIARVILHYRTRKITPKEGQEWWQEGSILRIGKRWPKGHFTIHSGSTSWGETDEKWQQRVNARMLFLIEQ